jgi:Holliday junction DNA helicase RuvA
MITRVTGRLARVLDDEVRLEVGPIEYQILVPEMVRRQIQMNVGQEIRFVTTQYFESAANGARFIPRLIGFLNDSELEFFELFCTVEKIGVKKALKALARPVKEIADAISRQDAKWLASLPGIGAASSEQIVTTLKRKVTGFALSAPSESPASSSPLIEDLYSALMGLGLNPLDARGRLDQLLKSGKSFETFDDAMKLLFAKS